MQKNREVAIPLHRNSWAGGATGAMVIFIWDIAAIFANTAANTESRGVIINLN